MPRQLIPPEPWWADAADLMVRSDLSLRQAAAELGVDLTIEEAENIKGRKLFQKILDEVRTAYYTEIGSSPSLSKDLVVGQLYKLANRLAEEGEAYKASDALLKLAKIKGWVGYEPDTLMKALAPLKQRDIDELKRRLAEKRANSAQAPEEATESDAEPEQVN